MFFIVSLVENIRYAFLSRGESLTCGNALLDVGKGILASVTL